MPLNYNNSIPLYVQLKEKLIHNIKKGNYGPKIPSEREIMDEFYVSRSTVRQAVAELVSEGFLVRRPGRGTFIALKPIHDWLGNLSSTTETIEKMGMQSGARLLDTQIISLSPNLQKITGLTEAFHFKRLRYANHIPMGIENHYYPITLGKQISKYDLNKETIYDLLETKLGIHTFEAEQVIRADIPSKEEASLMNISQKSSLLVTDRKLVDINNQFVEYEHALYRADMYSFKIKLSRKNS
ncbi:GntR family transcriptional regulator [Virgibacillus halodenitrificans]|uniref:GntR family transcriptional regulator n=1 Tax=Virgibacillus halodenitrificans TaxID=1482 RepID=UPI0002E46021|nr:GntR family transcriptional regulator [Virgibacillus halodenitrificans]MYL56469.1 UTRA domain-containing protein [Virgibacillus halodenitrificans]